QCEAQPSRGTTHASRSSSGGVGGSRASGAGKGEDYGRNAMPVKSGPEDANGWSAVPGVAAQGRSALAPAPAPTGATGTGMPGAGAGAPALRSRERLGSRGAGALSDAELLALVLGSGSARLSALRIGRALARRRPAELARWPAARWLRVPGVGPARAAALAAAFELGRRAAERGAAAAPIPGADD